MARKTTLIILLCVLTVSSFGQGFELFVCLADSGKATVFLDGHTHHHCECRDCSLLDELSGAAPRISHGDRHTHILIHSSLPSSVLPTNTSEKQQKASSGITSIPVFEQQTMNASSYMVYGIPPVRTSVGRGATLMLLASVVSLS